MQSAFDHEVAAGETVLPVQGSAGRTGPRPPKLEANDPFMLVYDPARYTVMHGRVVPQFRQLALTPGVNGVTESRNREGRVVGVHLGMALAMASDRGHIAIPFDAIPESQHHLCRGGAISYIWRPTGTNAHLTIWTRCFAGSKKVVEDAPAYIAWIDWLVEIGKIPPAPLHVLEDLRQQRIDERDKMADRALTVPSLRGLVERLTADIDAITATIAARGVPIQSEDEDEPDIAQLVEATGAAVNPAPDESTREPPPPARKGR